MFKWVHVSDLHFYSDDGAMAKTLKEKLPKALEKIEAVDALFITGDFRYAKAGALDVSEPINYIGDLIKALKIKIECVFCVPGNHDLTRTKKRTYLVQGISGVDGKSGDYKPSNGTFDSDSLNSLNDDFGYFSSFQNQLDGTNFRDVYSNVHRVILHKKCNILMLNTAITSCSDSDRGSLLLGVNYLRDALAKLNRTKPTIMIGHHGHSFLEREESKEIQKYLHDNGIHIYLCGHEHDLVKESVWDNVQQFSAGCIWEDKTAKIAKAGFFVGEFDDDYAVTVKSHEWNTTVNDWKETHTFDAFKLFNSIGLKKSGDTIKKIKDNTPENDGTLFKILKENEPALLQFVLNGHTLLGARGKEGIKYYWLKNGDRVESLTFNRRQNDPHPDPIIRAKNDKISAYTSSLSFGCILAASNRQCRFCETGAREFHGLLSAEEIALQNIFMAVYDANCPSYPEVRDNEREFAFMGQGEPGYSYSQIKRSILLIDRAMDAIHQKIYRYIISTCGIPDFIYQLIQDVKLGLFPNKVSLHFSLHAVGEERKKLMPIEIEHSYKAFIQLCKEFYHVYNEVYGVNEKIGVGVLTFKKFLPTIRSGETQITEITLDKLKLKAILNELDPEIFRIDLSDFNHAPTVTERYNAISEEEIKELLVYVKSQGFEAKSFSSFGSGYDAGCGMLKSAYLDVADDGTKTKQKYDEALRLLNYAIQKLHDEGL